MILKYKVNESGSVMFIDNIVNFSIEQKDNPIKPTEVFVRLDRANENFGLKLTTEAYLMNDKGQTIERLI